MLNKYLLGKREKMLIPVSSSEKPTEPNSGSRAPQLYSKPFAWSCSSQLWEALQSWQGWPFTLSAYDLTTLEHFPLPLSASLLLSLAETFQTSLRSGYKGRRIHLVSVRKVLLRSAGPGWHRFLGMWTHCLKQWFSPVDDFHMCCMTLSQGSTKTIRRHMYLHYNS